MARIAPIFCLVLVLAAPAAAAPGGDAEARSRSEALLRQLLAEDDHPAFDRTRDGEDRLVLETRARGTATGGMCVRDELSIRRTAAPEGGPPGPIREIEAHSEYAVLTDQDARPQWQVTDAALTVACLAFADGDTIWFPAEDPASARDAVVALYALVDAAREPGTPRIECTDPNCPDGARLAAMIDPLSPVSVHRQAFVRLDCPGDSRCLVTRLVDGCGTWTVQLRLAPDEEPRFRSARIGLYLNDQRICGI